MEMPCQRLSHASFPSLNIAFRPAPLSRNLPSFPFPFLSASPPIEWLSDKACDYIDWAPGQLRPHLSVGLLCPFLSLSLPELIAFPSHFCVLTRHVPIFITSLSPSPPSLPSTSLHFDCCGCVIARKQVKNTGVLIN